MLISKSRNIFVNPFMETIPMVLPFSAIQKFSGSSFHVAGIKFLVLKLARIPGTKKALQLDLESLLTHDKIIGILQHLSVPQGPRVVLSQAP
jgi:hypothetical protein